MENSIFLQQMKLIEIQFLVNEFCFYFLNFMYGCMNVCVDVHVCVNDLHILFICLCVYSTLLLAPSQNVFHKFEQ